MQILIEKECFMPVAKEQIRQTISENNLNSVTDVYALLRDSFKDILQELMEAERIPCRFRRADAYPQV